ncbi:hypothetical protein ACQBAR_04550 [Propionibacteriaceae bacterium Y1685]
MTQQPWLEPTDDDLSRRGEHPYQRADQVELRGDPASHAPVPASSARADRAADRAPGVRSESGDSSQSFILAIISLGVGIPITAIAATNVTPSLLGVLIVWIGIIGVNLAFGLSRRR